VCEIEFNRLAACVAEARAEITAALPYVIADDAAMEAALFADTNAFIVPVLLMLAKRDRAEIFPKLETWVTSPIALCPVMRWREAKVVALVICSMNR
jgi:hypothetical protein